MTWFSKHKIIIIIIILIIITIIVIIIIIKMIIFIIITTPKIVIMGTWLFSNSVRDYEIGSVYLEMAGRAGVRGRLEASSLPFSD